MNGLDIPSRTPRPACDEHEVYPPSIGVHTPALINLGALTPFILENYKRKFQYCCEMQLIWKVVGADLRNFDAYN